MRFFTWIRDILNHFFAHYKFYFWTTVWIFAGLLTGVLIISFNREHNKLDYTAIYIWAFAFFFFGGLLGCLFAVPKVVANTKSGTLSTVAAVGGTSTTDEVRNHDKEATNLTDISDWLTKIVIGAGLVELKQIPPYVMRIADRMARDIDVSIPHQPFIYHTNTLCAGVLVYYTCFGLITGYFLMRSIFSDMFK